MDYYVKYYYGIPKDVLTVFPLFNELKCIRCTCDVCADHALRSVIAVSIPSFEWFHSPNHSHVIDIWNI